MSRAVFDRLLPELRGRAFTIAGVEGARVMQRVRDVIAGLPQGGEGNTWDQLKHQVVDELGTYLGDGAEDRAELLMRTHGFQAFNASVWRVAQEDSDTTHLQYLATEDERVRATHLALNGLVLPKNDPFWQTHFPPWEWNCRCRVRPMNPDLVADEKDEDKNRNPEDRNVVTGAVLKQLQNGTLIRDGQRYDVTPPQDGPEGDRAYQFNPENLRLPLEELKQLYDPEVWEGFVAWAKANEISDGLTVWEWLKQRQRDFEA